MTSLSWHLRIEFYKASLGTMYSGGYTVTESMKNDIAVAQRLGITATTLEGILTVKGQGRR